MKYQKTLLALTLFIGFAVSAQSTPKSPDDDRDTSKVATTVKTLFAAMVDPDENTLGNLTLEELSYGHSSGSLENKSQFIDAVVNGTFDYISIDASDQTITITGDIAMVRHIFMTKGKTAGNLMEVRIGNLMIFRKRGGEWKLLARQAYKL